jgi:hypothetical protein
MIAKNGPALTKQLNPVRNGTRPLLPIGNRLIFSQRLVGERVGLVLLLQIFSENKSNNENKKKKDLFTHLQIFTVHKMLI